MGELVSNCAHKLFCQPVSCFAVPLCHPWWSQVVQHGADLGPSTANVRKMQCMTERRTPARLSRHVRHTRLSRSHTAKRSPSAASAAFASARHTSSGTSAIGGWGAIAIACKMRGQASAHLIAIERTEPSSGCLLSEAAFAI